MVLKKADKVIGADVKAEPEQTPVMKESAFVKAGSEPVPEVPKKSELASKYPKITNIYHKLEKQNTAIYEREQQYEAVPVKYHAGLWLQECEGISS